MFRFSGRFASLVAFVVIVAVGCSTPQSVVPGASTGNGPTGALPPPMAIGTRPSRDPGSIRPKPMAQTAQLDPQIFTGTLPGRRGQVAVVDPSWHAIPGGGIQIVVSPADPIGCAGTTTEHGSVFVLSSTPAGPDKYIWEGDGQGNWCNIPGLASHLAAAPNGTLYAVNSSGGIYSWNGSAWTGLAGGAVGVAAGPDSSLYVLSNANPSGDESIWHFSAGTWTYVPGSGVQIAVTAGGLYVLTSHGYLYRGASDGSSYVGLPGTASAIAPVVIQGASSGGIYALGYPGDPVNGDPIWYYDLDSGAWRGVPGSGVSIAALSLQGAIAPSLWIVSSSGSIYTSSIVAVTTPTPTASPTSVPTAAGATPFPTPSATPNLTLSCDTSSQRCGVQRWHTKTLDDVDEHKIDWNPVAATVTQMTQFPVPTGYNESGPGGSDVGRFPPYELEIFTVRALLITRKHETGSSGDDDYHIEVADPDNPTKTMVTEAPHGECTYACASGFGGFFDNIRNTLDTCFGAATSSFQAFPAGVVVNFTGVGFFDGLHGQTGALANPGSPASNFELHPLLFMEFVSGKPTNVPGC